MKRNYKSLLSVALVLLLVTLATLTFAFWDQLTGNADGKVQIGEGKKITITETLSPEGRLIPNGAAKGANDVYEVEVKYEVELTEFVEGFELVVEGATAHELVNLEINHGQFTENTLTVEVVATFTLDEPANEAEYMEVAGKAITYSLTFEYKPVA